MGNAVMTRPEVMQTLGVDDKRLCVIEMMGDLKVLYKDPFCGADMYSISAVEALRHKIQRGELKY